MSLKPEDKELNTFIAEFIFIAREGTASRAVLCFSQWARSDAGFWLFLYHFITIIHHGGW